VIQGVRVVQRRLYREEWASFPQGFSPSQPASGSRCHRLASPFLAITMTEGSLCHQLVRPV